MCLLTPERKKYIFSVFSIHLSDSSMYPEMPLFRWSHRYAANIWVSLSFWDTHFKCCVVNVWGHLVVIKGTKLFHRHSQGFNYRVITWFELVCIDWGTFQVNCILEAFGHAKTPRNDNSSRFIKLLTVQYCEKRETMLSGNQHEFERVFLFYFI